MPQFDLFIENEAIQSYFAGFGAGHGSPMVIGRFATAEDFATAVQALHVTTGTKAEIATEAARRSSPDPIKSTINGTDADTRAFYDNLAQQPKRHRRAEIEGVLYVVNGDNKVFGQVAVGEKAPMLRPVVLTDLLDSLAQKA